MNVHGFFSPDEEAWRAYVNDPLPGWGSRSFTLFDVPALRLEADFAPVPYAVFSVPFDSTASTRIGARYGPRAIREASLAYSSQLKSRGPVKLRNMRTGALLTVRDISLVDFGDLHVYPSDPAKQMRATADEVFHVAMKADCTLLLGGEHSLSFPSFCAIAAATRLKHGKTLGYLHIDHHFDFGTTSVLHGAFYHGSNSRRISEHPWMFPQAMGFLGVGDLTSEAQYRGLLASGTPVYSMADIRVFGFEKCLREMLDRVASRVDVLYVSLDIDVCDTATAPGTGHVTVGGISSVELFSAVSILQEYPVVALDIMEISPTLDSSGATAHLAARFLFEWLFLERVPEDTPGNDFAER